MRFSLRAAGNITEDIGASIYVPTNGQFSATSISGNLSLNSSSNGIDGVISLQSPNTINLVNSVDTTVGSVGDGPDLGGPEFLRPAGSLEVEGEEDVGIATPAGHDDDKAIF